MSMPQRYGADRNSAFVRWDAGLTLAPRGAECPRIKAGERPAPRGENETGTIRHEPSAKADDLSASTD
jgi:hypothetical protein